MVQLPLSPEQDAWRLERLTRNLWNALNNDPDLTLRMLCQGNCHIAKDFAEEFDLEVREGFCNGTEHFWCVDKEGRIIDPTAEQFHGPREYRELDPEKDEIQVGRCPNCGWEIYATKNQALRGEVRTDICSEECAESYTTYICREATRYGSR